MLGTQASHAAELCIELAMAHALPMRQAVRALGYHLHIDSVHTLGPDEWWAQQQWPHLACVWLFPSSSPLTVVHRRLGSRVQHRQIIPAGGTLLRPEAARLHWTLALPPLISSETLATGERPDATRRFMVLRVPSESSG